MSEFSGLAIETSTTGVSVAACRGSRSSLVEDRGHRAPSRDIFRFISEALDGIDLELRALDCIVFGCGPGSFTGLRVAAAAAQSLAWGTSTAVCRMSTLEAMACTAFNRHGASHVAAGLDARRGGVYLGVYARTDSAVPEPVSADALLDPQAIELPDLPGLLAIGSAWSACPELYERNAARLAGRDADLLPCAADMLAAAEARYRAGQTVTAAQALPDYLRDDVVQPGG